MSKDWIKRAVGSGKGNLHRALNVPEGEKIPAKKIAKAAKAGGKLGKGANLARTLSKFKKK